MHRKCVEMKGLKERGRGKEGQSVWLNCMQVGRRPRKMAGVSSASSTNVLSIQREETGLRASMLYRKPLMSWYGIVKQHRCLLLSFYVSLNAVYVYRCKPKTYIAICMY